MPPKARHGAACGGSSPADSSRQASSRRAASPHASPRPASPRPASPRDLPSPRLPEPADDVLAASKAHRSPGTSPGGRRRRRGGREGGGGEREGEREGGAAEGGGAGGEGSSPAGAREGHGRAGAAGHLRRGAHGAPAEEDTVGRGREAGREAGPREGDAPPVPEKAPVPADEDDEALALEAAAPHEEPRGHGTKHHVKHYRPRQRAAAASDAEREAWVRERGADLHARRRERDHGATAHYGGGHERGHHHSRGAQSHGHGGHSHRRTRSPEAQRRPPEAQRRHRSGKRLDSAAPQGMTKPGSAALAALTTGSSAQKFTNSKRDEDGLLFA